MNVSNEINFDRSKLIDTINLAKLLQIPISKSDNYEVFIIDVATYIKELEDDIKLENQGFIDLEGTRYHFNGIVSSVDLNLAAEDISLIKSRYGLLIYEGTYSMNPSCYLHTLTRKGMFALATLEDYELDPSIKQYCARVANLCNDAVSDDFMNCSCAYPNENSKSVLKSE